MYTTQQDRLLFDSGAAVHVCPLDYATEYPHCTSGSKPSFRTVTGEAITAHGARAVHYQMDARSALTITYVVADVSMPVLSVSRLLRLGYVTVLAKGNSYLQPHGASFSGPFGYMVTIFTSAQYAKHHQANVLCTLRPFATSGLETGRGDLDTSTQQTSHGGSSHPQG